MATDTQEQERVMTDPQMAKVSALVDQAVKEHRERSPLRRRLTHLRALEIQDECDAEDHVCRALHTIDGIVGDLIKWRHDPKFADFILAKETQLFLVASCFYELAKDIRAAKANGEKR